MKINVARLSEALPELDLGGCPDVTDDLVSWFSEALPITLGHVPEQISHEGLESDMPAEIDVFLCSREEMDVFDDSKGSLGLFLVDTPDFDPFNDDSPLAKRLRVLVVIDKAEIVGRLEDEIRQDDERWERYLHEYENRESATAFHEVAHAGLFAANGGMMSPHAIESAVSSGDLNYDLFDVISGYGIRGLVMGGREIWAEDAEDAKALMEEWCDEVGTNAAGTANATLGTSFYRVLGIDPEKVAEKALNMTSEPQT